MRIRWKTLFRGDREKNLFEPLFLLWLVAVITAGFTFGTGRSDPLALQYPNIRHPTKA